MVIMGHPMQIQGNPLLKTNKQELTAASQANAMSDTTSFSTLDFCLKQPQMNPRCACSDPISWPTLTGLPQAHGYERLVAKLARYTIVDVVPPV